jgi:hypothetical protein
MAVFDEESFGAAFINAVTASDARVPFGGTRKSGYGRELAAAGTRVPQRLHLLGRGQGRARTRLPVQIAHREGAHALREASSARDVIKASP